MHYELVVCRLSWGRPSATPLPFFILWLQIRVLQLLVFVCPHYHQLPALPSQAEMAKLHLFMDLYEIQVGKSSYSDVLFVTVNVYVCVCLFNIAVFEMRDDTPDCAHIGQMHLGVICICGSPPPLTHWWLLNLPSQTVTGSVAICDCGSQTD